MRLQQPEIAVTVSGMKFNFSRCWVIEQQVGITIFTKVSRNNQLPGFAPSSILLQQREIAPTISGMKFTFSRCWVIEQQVGVTISTKISRNNQLPGFSRSNGTPEGLDIPVPISEIKFNYWRYWRLKFILSVWKILRVWNIVKQTGVTISTKVSRNNQMLGCASSNVVAQQREIAATISGVNFSYSRSYSC